jgi:hypothetical protein
VKTPDGFATALISADIGIDTFVWNGTTRCGGSAHKVIRWAFENQGLYQLAQGRDGPGAPPPVDIFIDDQRDLIHPVKPQLAKKMRGGYDPAPLDTAKWQAADDALWVQRAAGNRAGRGDRASVNKKNYVFARVRNRGQQKATSVQVTVWCAPMNGSAIPAWPDSTAWTQLQGPAKTADIKSGGSRKFGPFIWVPQAAANANAVVNYALLAIATCADDPSNADPATLLPCAVTPGRTDFLVSCDNNLGLRTVIVG